LNSAVRQSHYVSFLPRTLITHAISGQLAEDKLPFSETNMGIVLFSDISGFTALAESLAHDRHAGAERLTTLLNGYFEALINQIASHGGDIIKFAGDAMLVLWTVEREKDTLALARQAVSCAQALQDAMARHAASRGETLAMKVAVNAGPMRQVCLGGLLDRRELILTGEALTEIGHANDHAKPGDIILCDGIKALLSTEAVTEEETADFIAYSPVHILSPDEFHHVRSYVPAAIRKALDAGQADWVSENRQVSLLFVNLGNFSESLSIGDAQAAMRAMQSSLYAFEGSLNKISVDDKGVSLLAALGMPPFTHTDDPVRAVQAALAIHQALSDLGVACKIGVASGRVFCGVVGSPQRREYTLMGDTVNLSARLMQASGKLESGLPILVDEPTWRGSRHRIDFQPGQALKLKGKANPVASYQAVAVLHDATEQGDATGNMLLGRHAELQQVRDRAVPVRALQGSVLIHCTGSVGCGRGSLVRAASAELSEHGFVVITLACSALKQTTPWGAWQNPFRNWLDLPERVTDTADIQNRVARHLQVDETWMDRIALLEAIIPVHWDDTPTTRGLTGAARGKATADFLLTLYKNFTLERPVCLVLQAAEWMDTASLDLLNRVINEIPGSLVLAISDTQADSRQPWCQFISSKPACLQDLHLPPLPTDVLCQIASRETGCESLSALAVQLIAERANGSPLHAVHIVRALLDAGNPQDSLDLPASIEGLLVARIDRLSPEVSLSGKVAAVVAQYARLHQVAQLHPSRPELHELQHHTGELVKTGFVHPHDADALDATGHEMVFLNEPTRDAFYRLLPVNQRQALHQQMASLLEAEEAQAPGQWLEELTHHWHAASELSPGADQPRIHLCADKACTHSATLARRNLRLGAMAEAQIHYERMLSVCERHATAGLREHEIDALLGLSNVRSSRFGWADEGAAAALERAIPLCEGGARRSAVFHALRGLWQARVGRSEYDISTLLAQQLLTFAQDTPADEPARPALLAEAQRAIGTNAFWIGDFARAKQHLQAALGVEGNTASSDNTLDLTQDTEVAARGMLGWTLAVLGESDAGLQQAERALTLARQLQSPFSLAYAMGAAMWAALHAEDVIDCQQQADEALAICQDKGFEYLATAARVVASWARAWAGDKSALQDLETAISDWRAKGQSIGVTAFTLQHIRALLKHGEAKAALHIYRSDYFVEGLNKEPWVNALMDRVRLDYPGLVRLPE
jgi:class 3 adenylate cyclase